MGAAVEFQKIRLNINGTPGSPHWREDAIARVTTMFQSGEVTQDNAAATIRAITRAEWDGMIETTRVAVKSLATGLSELRETHLESKRLFDEEQARLQDEKAKAQGLAPRERPTI